MPLQLSRQGIRLRADERSRQPLLDAYTNATPQGWVKASTQFEVALARGGALVDVANLTSVTLQGTPAADRDGARAFAQTVPLAGLDNTLTEATWANGTRQHALFTFSQAEMNLPVDADTGSADYWIVITALTAGGDQIVCGGGRLTMTDDGVFQTAAAPPLNPGAAITLGEADARYLQPASAPARLAAGATLLVDAATGNDALAARGTLAAFATLTAARAAARPGDLIRVRPGAYDENDLGRDGVHWHFEAGALVTYTGPSAVGLWDDHAGPLRCKVAGAGEFRWNGTGTGAGGQPTGCVNVQNAGSDVNLEARVVATTNGGGSPGTGALNQGAGVLRVRAFRIEQTNATATSPAAIWWTQGELRVEAFEIAAGKYGLYANAQPQATPNQGVWVRAGHIRCPQWQWQGDASAQLWLDALEIDLSGNAGASLGGGQMVLAGPRAHVQAQKVSGNGDAPAYLPAAGVLTAANAWLRLLKLTQAGHGPALVVGGCTGQIDQIEDSGGACRVLLCAGGNAGAGASDLVVQKMVVANPAGVGVEHQAGTLRLRGACIDATAATAGNPVKVDAPGLTLLGGCVLAAAGRESVYAAAAQSVQIVGALAANRPVNANVTLDASQNLPAPAFPAGVDILPRNVTAAGCVQAGSTFQWAGGPALTRNGSAGGQLEIFALSDLKIDAPVSATGPLTLRPQPAAPAAPTDGVTLYVDAAGDLHALHSSGADHTLSAH